MYPEATITKPANTRLEAAPRQPFLMELCDRLGNLGQLLGAAEDLTSGVRARVLGPWPTDGESASRGNDPGNQSAQILAVVDELTARARRLVDNARALNEGL